MPKMTVGETIPPVQLSVTSGSPAVTKWTVSGLPAGVAASASGLISGTPTTAGVGTVEVAGTSAAGMIGTASAPWEVEGAPKPEPTPVIAPFTMPKMTVGETL